MRIAMCRATTVAAGRHKCKAATNLDPLPCLQLRSALPLRAAGGSGQRVFGWSRLGRRVAFDLARALNYIHSQGVVHMVRFQGRPLSNLHLRLFRRAWQCMVRVVVLVSVWVF